MVESKPVKLEFTGSKVILPLTTFVSILCLQNQCDQIWQNFARFGRIFKVLGNFGGNYLLFGKILELLWQVLRNTGRIYVHVNGQMLKNNLAIWSHCPQSIRKKTITWRNYQVNLETLELMQAKLNQNIFILEQEPWPSGYGWWLMFVRSWV